MTRQTMRAAILMEVTVVDQMLTPNTVQNVFVINNDNSRGCMPRDLTMAV